MILVENSMILDAEAFDGLLVDLDGVVTRTARLHATVWKKLFDEILAEEAARRSTAFQPFDQDSDYRTYVDGKPRLDGLRAFLTARGIKIPLGEPDDPPEKETLYGLSTRKNAYFENLIEQEGIPVYDTSLSFLKRAREAGWKTAVVSSSKNCGAILAAAGLADLFDARVDGNDLEALGLPGKPAPDAYRTAAERLQITSVRAVVIEDSSAGVEAGRVGGFGYVIGVDRGGQKDALYSAGADVVVEDLSAVSAAGKHITSENTAPPNALDRFDEIARAVTRRHPALFLDYDGTLTAIVARPELAQLSEEMRSTLRELSRICTIAIISGRARRDVEKLVGLADLYYAGAHGFDISGPHGQRIQHQEGAGYVPALAEAEQELREASSNIKGALIEGKKYAVACHYRLVAPKDVVAFRQRVETIASRHPELRVTGGKKVFELRPGIDWDKGKAVLWLLDALRLSAGDVVPVYFGDDLTDEDAFKALANGGIGILVAEDLRPTTARYLLRDPGEVQQFLKLLADVLREPSP